jgi:integrase
VRVTKLFTGLVKILEHCGRSDVSTALKQQLNPSVTGVSRFKWFSSQSQWHEDVATKILDAIVAARCQTHFPEKLTQKWEGHVGKMLAFLLEHVPKTYASEFDQSNAVKWFLENCTLAKAETACRELAQQADVYNERVRSSRPMHHAESALNQYVNLFKFGVAALHGDTSELSRLDAQRILSGIANKRVASEGTERRTFAKGEVDAMLEASKCDTRHTLLLRLLREVGLRIGCLSNLKYGMLLDESHTPRHVCRVPEKNKSWRGFVTSTALKQAIKSHAEMMRQAFTVERDMYIFNTANPSKPYGTRSIENMVKLIARDAGVEGSHVHPHAFRHTIVGELVDAGNSIDVVSKYMGHAQVSTTAQYYWVPTVTELHDKLKNPFTGQLQQVQETEDELKRDREMLRTKLDAALRLMQHQNVVFRTAASQGATADEALRRFQTLAPDAEEILRVILESSGTSQTGSAAMQQSAPSRAAVPSVAPIPEGASACPDESSAGEGDEEEASEEELANSDVEQAPPRAESPTRKRRRH